MKDGFDIRELPYNAMKTPAYPMAINQAELNASRQFR